MFVIGLFSTWGKDFCILRTKKAIKRSSGIEQVLPPCVFVFSVCYSKTRHLPSFSSPSILNLNLSCAKKEKSLVRQQTIDTNDENSPPSVFLFSFSVLLFPPYWSSFSSLSWKRTWKRRKKRGWEHRKFLSVCWVDSSWICAVCCIQGNTHLPSRLLASWDCLFVDFQIVSMSFQLQLTKFLVAAVRIF